MRGYHNYIDIVNDLGVNQAEFKKALKENDLIHEPWVKVIDDINEVYRLRKSFGMSKAKELVLISTKLKRLIYKEYARCLGTKFKPNFQAIRKDIEYKKINIASSSEIKSKEDIKNKIEKPGSLKLDIIRSYEGIMKGLGVQNSKITEYALECVNNEEDPFIYVKHIYEMEKVSKRKIYENVISNKIYELTTEFGDDLEARRRFCLGLQKATGFNFKYIDKSLDNIFDVLEVLDCWDKALELCS